MTERPSLVWFRQDLRLADNPALAAACARGGPVICLYVLDDETQGAWRMGGASRWWLHHSLAALSADLASQGQRLTLRQGRGAHIIKDLVAEAGADAVFWNRRYEPAQIAHDTALKADLAAMGIAVHSFNSALLHEPWTVKTQGGGSFRVFSPFWRACLAKGEPAAPLPRPAFAAPSPDARGDALEDWQLVPSRPNWAAGFEPEWQPGEAGAHRQLARFLARGTASYPDERNRPDLPGTSRLSPHLAFGEIGPRQIWSAARFSGAASNAKGTEKFLSEIGWREFSYHLLANEKDLPSVALRPEFRDFPWADDPAALAAWRKGRTGVPIVDAGMRQLWQTGWMHNRVRMIAASFLVKHLLIPWQHGAAWFWDTLVDADLANNSASWQWVAGCGADAAPYFRVFNPVLQGLKFDPDGAYVRRFVPELANLPAHHIHAPWEAPADMLAKAGVSLGGSYPHRLVDLAAGRARALAAFAALKDAA
jgi:deoxyribodipyrimidine photo-lyase